MPLKVVTYITILHNKKEKKKLLDYAQLRN